MFFIEFHKGDKNMSCNYYFNPSSDSEYSAICHLHIGNSHGPNSFTFHGVDIDSSEQCAKIGSVYIHVNIPRLLLKSKKDWENFLRSQDGKGEIVDEYNRTISVEEFINSVKNGHNSRYKDDVRQAMKKCNSSEYLDDEGYIIMECEFS
jgi:hypothetical protein